MRKWTRLHTVFFLDFHISKYIKSNMTSLRNFPDHDLPQFLSYVIAKKSLFLYELHRDLLGLGVVVFRQNYYFRPSHVGTSTHCRTSCFKIHE